MNEIEKAWVAGFIEGEGCLTILKSSLSKIHEGGKNDGGEKVEV